VTGYTEIDDHHPESMAVPITYRGDVPILSEKQRRHTDVPDDAEVTRDMHGNAHAADLHYHAGLAKGSNTVNAQLSRVIMRLATGGSPVPGSAPSVAPSVGEAAASRGFALAPSSWLDGVKAFLTTPGETDRACCHSVLRPKVDPGRTLMP